MNASADLFLHKDHADIKEAVNKQAYERFEKSAKSADSVVKAEAEGLSKRFESKLWF